MAEKQRKSKFKKFLKIYVIILFILMIAFLGYVTDSLNKYEENQLKNYIPNVVSNLDKYINIEDLNVSEFENKDSNISEVIDKIKQKGEITYKASTEQENVYEVYAGETNVLNIKLNGENTENRLGLLTFCKWEVENIEPNVENILNVFNINVPNNYEVYVNEKKLAEDQIKEEEQDSGLKQISKYVDIPYIVEYEISNLLNVPNVKILDENGNEVEYEINENSISIDLNFKSIADKDEALKEIKGSINIEKIAEDWSLFLSDDLSGSRHGFYTISEYFIKDSDIYTNAYKWATGEDITFVSNHYLLEPTFSNERLENFEIYNENAFSCEIYLQKNLRLTNGGKKIEDIMHERMYFAYYDDTDDEKDNPEWKLVNLQSITDES